MFAGVNKYTTFKWLSPAYLNNNVWSFCPTVINGGFYIYILISLMLYVYDIYTCICIRVLCISLSFCEQFYTYVQMTHTGPKQQQRVMILSDCNQRWFLYLGISLKAVCGTIYTRVYCLIRLNTFLTFSFPFFLFVHITWNSPCDALVWVDINVSAHNSKHAHKL